MVRKKIVLSCIILAVIVITSITICFCIHKSSLIKIKEEKYTPCEKGHLKYADPRVKRMFSLDTLTTTPK